jgi:hypothetical protein
MRFNPVALTLQERLVDLGPHGVLALTLNSGVQLASSGAQPGYARWYANPANNEQPQERRSCLIRTTKLANGSVAETWPTHAHALAEGHVLVLFGGVATEPQLLRIVDVVQGRIHWEITVDALRSHLGVQPEPYMPATAIVTAHSDTHFRLYLGVVPATVLQVVLEPPSLVAVEVAWCERFTELAFSNSHVLEHEQDGKQVRIALLSATSTPPITLQAQPATRRFVPTLARRGNRLALSLARGDVQVVDLANPSAPHRKLRPADDAVAAEPLALVMSPAGGYLLQLDDSMRAGTLVDLDNARRTQVQLPEWDPQPQANSGEPPLNLRADWLITDDGCCVLEGGNLHYTLHASQRWQPLGESPPRHARAVQPPASMLAALRRPSLALLPARQGTSHLYGAAHLAQPAAWPQHNGQAMVLLCELSLPELHAAIANLALPKLGWLQCFAAADAEGQVVEDELFNPVALHVRHEPDALAPLAPLPINHPPARYLRCKPDKADLPPPTHPCLTELAAGALSLHDYARWYDSRGTVKAGCRLGGYASAVQAQAPEAMVDADQPYELLLQLDSDSTYMWGTDSGLLYVLLPQGDAARGDFSRAIGLTQGH